MSDLAPVVDLAQFRAHRLTARRQILKAANRLRLARSRYVRLSIWRREVPCIILNSTFEVTVVATEEVA